jgi:hypothetical protein
MKIPISIFNEFCNLRLCEIPFAKKIGPNFNKDLTAHGNFALIVPD